MRRLTSLYTLIVIAYVASIASAVVVAQVRRRAVIMPPAAPMYDIAIRLDPRTMSKFLKYSDGDIVHCGRDVVTGDFFVVRRAGDQSSVAGATPCYRIGVGPIVVAPYGQRLDYAPWLRDWAALGFKTNDEVFCGFDVLFGSFWMVREAGGARSIAGVKCYVLGIGPYTPPPPPPPQPPPVTPPTPPPTPQPNNNGVVDHWTVGLVAERSGCLAAMDVVTIYAAHDNQPEAIVTTVQAAPGVARVEVQYRINQPQFLHLVARATGSTNNNLCGWKWRGDLFKVYEPQLIKQ